MLRRICNRATPLRRILLDQQRRHRSGRAQLIEIDLQAETDVVGVKKLEEMIRRIDVLKSTPEWLPFVPGASFWVPPRSDCRSPSSVAQMLLRMADTLSDDESLSLTTFQDNAGVKVTEEADVIVELRSVEADVEEEANSGKTSKS